MPIRFVTACHSQSQPAANPQSRSVTRAPLKIETRPHKSGITRAVPNASIFFYDFLVKPSSRCSLVRVFSEKQFFDQNGALAKDSCNFLSLSRPATAETNTLLRRPQDHIIPQGFSPDFHPWIHAFPNCCSSLLLPHANCSCSLCCWDDDHMMTWWKDCLWTFFCSSEVFELNFLWWCYRTHPAYCKICNQEQSRTMQV